MSWRAQGLAAIIGADAAPESEAYSAPVSAPVHAPAAAHWRIAENLFTRVLGMVLGATVLTWLELK